MMMKGKEVSGKKTVNVTISVDSDFFSHLRKLSYSLSSEEDKRVTVSELVRRSLREKYPLSKELSNAE